MRAINLHTLMLHALVCTLLLFSSFSANSQAESHNFTTYDTVISLPQMGNPFGANDQWNVRISRPLNMFTPGNPDTASRPAIIMMPGIGEQGNSNTANLVVYGPHYWLNNGWDGSVVLGNGTHYPILITISYINTQNPTAPAYYNVLTLLLNTYHIKRNAVHLTGLSQGAFTNGALIKFEITAGAESGMKLATSAALFEGTPDPLPAPYSTWDRDTVAYKVWAAKYHGRYFFLEGNGSDNFRDGWHYATAINDSVPGTAYFSYEDLGGGAHCCWNSMYDPTATNWTSVGVLGPNNAPSQTGTDVMGDYRAPSSVFQWELQQGDTSMVGGAPVPPPTVSAGSNQNITLPTNSVTLTGTASELNGTIASYAWTETSGPAGTITTPAAAGTTVTGMAAGTYVFQLLVTDGLGNTATSTVQVVVAAAPAPVPPPTVSAGSNQNITLPTNSVTLTGTASELNGTIASYAWTETSGPAGTITTPAAAGTTVTSMVAGTYVFQLLVTDGLGNTATATVQVVVNPAAAPPPPAPVPPPTVSAGSNQNITLPTNSVTLTGTASELNGTIASYAWTETSGPADAITTPGSASTTVTGLTAGTYVYQLLVTDGLGNTATSTVQVVVNPAAAPPPPAPVPPPTVSAGSDQNITLPANSVTLTGTASELNGTIASYAWTETSGPAGTITTPAAAGTTVTGMVAGTYVFQLLVTDGLGNTATSTMQVVVNPAAAPPPPPPPAPVPPPTVSAGSNQNITLPTNFVTLTGTASELNGTIASYAWTETSGPAAVISSPSASGTTVTGLTAGTYVFQLLVTDGLGNTATSTVQVVVNPAAAPPPPAPVPPPTVSAGSNQSITLPANSVTLTGTASELNGTIASYAWTETSGPAGTITTPAAAGTTVTSMVAGTYVFQLLVTDGLGNTATSTVQVVVNPAVAPPPPPPPPNVGYYIDKVVVAEYRTWYIMSDSTIWAFNNGSPHAVQFTIGAGLKTIGGSGGFNYFRMLDTQGYLWTDVPFNISITTNNATRMNTDTTGAPFSGNWYVNAIGHVYMTIRADSSVWYGGKDAYSLFYPGGDPVNNSLGTTMSPTQLSPAGMKFKKVLFGGSRIVGLTTSGQVYQWVAGGSRTPTQMTIPRPATDIFVSQSDVAGCIIPDPGETSGMGYPFIWGTSYGMWGGSASYSQPTSLKALWNMTAPIKEIAADWNTIHYIDSLGRMYGTGYNPFGEVGNGQEFVNKYNYPGFPGYGWDFGSNEDPTGAPPTQIGAGVTWKHLYSNNWFGFYKYAQDVNDSVYSWGRNKGLVLGNGMENLQEQYSYDALDVLKPTMVHPLQSTYTTYNFTAPSISAGPKQVIAGATANMAAVIAPPLLIKSTPVAPNGIDTAGYHIVAYQWTQVSGNAATITSPNAVTTSVTGLSTGTYIFQLITTDNNTGTLMVRDTIIVTATVPGPLLVNAGSNQVITLPTNSVVFTGTASEVNGTIASYKWSQVSGPSTATIVTSSVASTSVTGLVQGIYRFQLLVTDALGITATATVQVTVNPAPAVPGPPVANAGSNQTITLPTNNVNLSGSGSETNGGTIVSYQWTQVSGPTTATIATSGQAATSVTGLTQGLYRFQLLVTDALGITATATVQVTVNAAVPVPGPPSANAGSDQTITLPTNSAALSGSGAESNGTIVSYAWTQVSGPSPATLGTPGQAATTVSGLVQGVYVFKLTVTDNSGVTATDVAQVTVNPTVPVPGTPVADAGSNQTITLPANSVTLSGSGTETSGTIVSYQWAQVSGPSTATIATSGQAATSVTGLAQGIYRFQLTVTDALGVTAASTVQVTVNPAAATPGAPSANAGSDQTITLPTNSATLSGSGTETNGTIVSYQWIQTSGPSSATITTAGQASTSVTGLVQGVYIFQLTITDNSGVTATDVVKITVNPAAALPGTPSANAGPDQTITLPTNSATLSGTGMETNGVIVSYAWTQISGPSTATIVNPGLAQTAVNTLLLGDYVFELTVTDSAGVTATDQVTVTVKASAAVNQPPVANAGPDQTTGNTSGVGLDGTASYDPDGTIVGYSWVQLSGDGGVTIVNSNSATPTLYGLQPGTYVFQLTVTDNQGATGTDEVTITITAGGQGNQAPVAIAGNDTTVNYPGGNAAILNGSASYDQSGTIVSYSWKMLSGPAACSMGDATDSVTSVSQLAVGQYVFELTVTDNNSKSSVSTVNVTVLDNERHSAFIRLYPNPAVLDGQITVEGANASTGNVKINIYDITGRLARELVMNNQATAFTLTVPLSGLPRGAYVLTIEFAGDSKPQVFKIIID